MASTQIKYRINSVTSESPNYPASNLTDSSTTLGWQSEYSPSYPQQLNIQFFTPIRTKTMRLVFHQYKIPSCVQIFVRLTSRQNFRKLGYIIPNDNSQSSYQHKEIKTLYFEFPCNYVKLVFYQNYKNEMNLFEQVALEELSVEGEAMTYNELRSLDFTEVSSEEDSEVETGDNSSVNAQNVSKNQPSNNRKTTLPQLNQTQSMQELNKQFQQVYSYLEEQKSQAVQNEDFRLAGNLKKVIETFKQTQQQITNLQLQKQQALSQEDFDKCHLIKEKIKKKKEEFKFRVEELKEDEDQFVAEYSHSRIIHDQRQSTDRKAPYQPQYANETDIKNYFSTTPEREPLGNAPQGRNIPTKNLEKQLPTSKQEKKTISHDDQVLPAVRNKLLGKKPQHEEEYPPETSRSQFQSSKSAVQNKSKLQGNKSNQQQYDNNVSKSPKDKHRSRSPPKSPKQQKPMQTPSNQNISLIKSPILTYQQLPQQTGQKAPQSPKQKPPSSSPQQMHPILTQLKQQFKDKQLDELDVKLRLKLQSHFQKIEQPYWQMIMHKDWRIKKMALNHVLEDILIQDKQTYMAVMEFISFSINDPHPQVILSSLHILRKLIQQGNQNNVHFTLPHLPYFIETIVTALLNLINSTNKQLSEQAYNLYLSMGMISFLTIQFLVQKIIKHKQSAKIMPQFTAMKISLMISLIQKYTQTTKHYRDILVWAIQFLKDPNNKVRSEASYVLLILVDIVGEDKVIHAIRDKPELLELFNQMLNNSQIIQSSRIENVSGLIEGGSRIQDRSKLEENNSLLKGNKSLSKQKLQGIQKNRSQLSQLHNPSSVSQKPSQTPSNRLKNPWTSNNQKQELRRQSSKSRLSHQKFEDEQLEYSKESDFYSSSRKESEMYVGRGYGQSQLSERKYEQEEREIRVLDQDQEQQYQQSKRRQSKQQQESYQEHQIQDDSYQNQDNTKCDYCFMDMQGMDQRQHLLRQCKVLVSCQQCMGRIYLREIIDHLLKDCTNRTHNQQCRKCGLVFGIQEINQHVGQGLCRLQRGDDWERCQFCSQDVMASDMKWIQHAYKCKNLPEVPITEPTEKTSQRGQEDY